MFFKQILSEYMKNFSYIVADEKTKEAVVIDPGYDTSEILKIIKANEFKVKYIINTHSHQDHIAGNVEIQDKTKAEIMMHESTAMPCDYYVKDGEEISIGSVKLKILHTPGHISDHICIFINNQKLLTGDLLFVGGIGATGPNFPTSNKEQMTESLRKIISLGDEVEVWPGHDYGQARSSTIGREKRTNPFLQEVLIRNK
ncbi:MBL fold metallo-hydrolase [Candidatus Woesearchaeota archaeon]|nr:MAG: MBL fold metallo-hydrolase [Candidatus Woesearchaeota archaeon]